MKKRILLILFISFVINNPVFSHEITDDYVDIAKDYLNNQNVEKAQEYTELVLLLDSKNKEALGLKNALSTDEKNVNKDKLVKIQENPILSQGNDVSANLINTGVDYYNQENFELAVYYFKKAIFESSKNYIAYYNLALCYKKQGKLLKSECCAKLSHKFNPQFTDALVLLASLKQGDEKIKVLNMAYILENYTADYYLGQYYQEEEKNYLLAITYYNDAIRLEQNLAQAYYKRAECYYFIEDYDLVITDLKDYLTYNYEDDSAHFLLAKAYLHKRLISNALHELNIAIEINKKQEYLFQLAKVYYYQHDYEKSLNILTSLLKEEEKAIYYNQKGLCYFEQENIDKALENFNKAVELDSQSATVYFNISRCYDIKKDKKMADEYISKAKTVEPQDVLQYIDTAFMYYKISENEKALETINKGIEVFVNEKKLYKAKMKLAKLIGNEDEYQKAKTDLSIKFGVKKID